MYHQESGRQMENMQIHLKIGTNENKIMFINVIHTKLEKKICKPLILQNIQNLAELDNGKFALKVFVV